MTQPFNLTGARLNAGYSIRGLAEHLDVPEQSIRRLENGEGIHPTRAKVIADFFDVLVTDILPVASTEAAA